MPALAPVRTIATRTWNAAGPFTVGRALRNDVSTDYFAGDVDDVSAYQEALGAAEIGDLRRTEMPLG